MLDNHELCTVDDSFLVVNILQEEYNIPGVVSVQNSTFVV